MVIKSKAIAGIPWTCGRGHVLGLVVRARVNGEWKSRLLKFRHAVSEEQLVVEIDAVLDGTVRDIVCDACPPDAPLMRTWWEDAQHG